MGYSVMFWYIYTLWIDQLRVLKIIHHLIHLPCFVMRTFKILSSSHFKLCDLVLLTIITLV
jgi:hypothetical protein